MSAEIPKFKGISEVSKADICIKCKVEAPKIIVRQAKFCRNCFMLNFVTKFRTNITRTEAPVQGDKATLLIGVSGGQSSVALLNLINEFHFPEFSNRKQQKFKDVIIGHIDESLLFPASEEERVQKIFSAYKIRAITRRLQDVFDTEYYKDFVQFVSLHKNGHPLFKRTKAVKDSGEMLKEFFNSIKTNSGREYMLERIISVLLLDIAREAGCQVIAVGDTASRLAAKSILYTAEGRGVLLPFEISGESKLEKDVYTIKPLRSALSKEVAFYNNAEGLQAAMIPAFSTFALPGSKFSLGHLTESFLNNLSREYSATTTTITSTVSKLKLSDELLSKSKCLLCNSFVSDCDWKSKFTVGLTNSVVQDNDPDVIDLSGRLCYSCLTTISEIEPGTVFPGFFECSL